MEAMNVSGMKSVEMTVRTFITSFSRWFCVDRNISITDTAVSRNDSTTSSACTAWS